MIEFEASNIDDSTQVSLMCTSLQGKCEACYRCSYNGSVGAVFAEASCLAIHTGFYRGGGGEGESSPPPP